MRNCRIFSGCTVFALVLLLVACQEQIPGNKADQLETRPAGKLFIIGGGKRPSEMIEKLLETAGIAKDESIYLLPWSGIEPDSSSFYAKKQFQDLGYGKFIDLQPSVLDTISSAEKSKITAAKLIYIPGGDQRRFMETANAFGYDSLLKKAYDQGATIAGTSAGAAIMSTAMITGTALRYEDYHPTFRTLETDNIELDSGLGLLPDNIIVDQHFIWRSRYNRLLTAIIENPDWLGWGIEESTAALVAGDSVTVVGKYQIIRFENLSKDTRQKNDLLGEDHIKLSIYLPGDKFSLK